MFEDDELNTLHFVARLRELRARGCCVCCVQCAYRISQDGLATVIPHLTKQMLTVQCFPPLPRLAIRNRYTC